MNKTTGTMVTYVHGQRLWAETYEADERAIRSRVTRQDGETELYVDWSTGHVTIRGHGTEKVLEIPNHGTVAFNGAWEPYGRLLDGNAAGVEGNVSLLLAETGRIVTVKSVVRQLPNRMRRLYLQLGDAVVAMLDVDTDGHVRRVRVPAQDLEARPEGTPESSANAGELGMVSVEQFQTLRGTATLRGVRWMPNGASPATPVAIFFAGSGPTDRDGNQPAVHTDLYKQLAEMLAQNGIGSVRYDKRGIGQSTDKAAEERVTFDDMVEDARAVVRSVHKDRPAAPIALIGHSEGALIALKLAGEAPTRSVVLMASPGRPLRDVLLEQVKRQMDAEALESARRALHAIAANKEVGEVPVGLRSLFRPSIRTYLRSQMDIDPSVLAKSVKVSLTILQGRHDLQVSEDDATRIKQAAPQANLYWFDTASHVFKEDAATGFQVSYADAEIPLAPGVADAVIEGIRRGMPASDPSGK